MLLLWLRFKLSLLIHSATMKIPLLWMQKNGSVALLLLYSCNDCLYQVSRIYCITSQGKAGTPIGGRSLSSHCLFILILILILILFVLFSVVFSLSLLLLLGSSLVARHGVVYRGGVRWGTVPSIGDLLLSVSSVLGYLRLKDVIFHFFGNDRHDYRASGPTLCFAHSSH